MPDCLSLALVLEGFGVQDRKSWFCLRIPLFRKPEWNGTQMLAGRDMSGGCAVGRVMSIVCVLVASKAAQRRQCTDSSICSHGGLHLHRVPPQEQG